jgi:presenilin-like A22 family membrane protease
MAQPKGPRSEIQRALLRLVIATLVAYVFLAGLSIFVYVDAANRRAAIAEVAVETNTALCALRGDLERRIAAAEVFLDENPDGVPGISAEVIRTSIANQQLTIDALSSLDCEVAPLVARPG